MTHDRPAPACPICAAPRSPRHRPFCSSRCAEVDLQRWLSDSYAFPVPPDEEQPDPFEPDEVAGQRGPGRL